MITNVGIYTVDQNDPRYSRSFSIIRAEAGFRGGNYDLLNELGNVMSLENADLSGSNCVRVGACINLFIFPFLGYSIYIYCLVTAIQRKRIL